MKSITWRRAAIILSFIIIGGIGFGAGYGMGAIATAEFFIDKAVKIMSYEGIFVDITRTELLEYYIKLKGGTI